MATTSKRITLAAARKAAKLSQSALARKTRGKVNQATISRIEAGMKRDWRSSTVRALAAALGLSVEELAV